MVGFHLVNDRFRNKRGHIVRMILFCWLSLLDFNFEGLSNCVRLDGFDLLGHWSLQSGLNQRSGVHHLLLLS